MKNLKDEIKKYLKNSEGKYKKLNINYTIIKNLRRRKSRKC